jgi:hypothetical protein
VSAQAPAAAPGQPAPSGIASFQAVEAGSQHSDVVVIDTANGQVWRRTLYAAQGWIEMGSPLGKRDRQK